MAKELNEHSGISMETNRIYSYSTTDIAVSISEAQHSMILLIHLLAYYRISDPIQDSPMYKCHPAIFVCSPVPPYLNEVSKTSLRS